MTGANSGYTFNKNFGNNNNYQNQRNPKTRKAANYKSQSEEVETVTENPYFDPIGLVLGHFIIRL